MGASLSDSEVATRTVMAGIYAELVAEHSRAVSRLGGASWWLDGAVEASLTGSLALAGEKLAGLAPNSARTNAVLTGSLPDGTAYSLDKWKELAGLVRDLIATVLKETGASAYSVGRFWDEVVSPTGSTVVDLVKKAADKADTALSAGADLVPWVVVGVVAVAVGYALFTFRGALGAK